MAKDQRGLDDFGKWKIVRRGLQWTPMSALAAPEGRGEGGKWGTGEDL